MSAREMVAALPPANEGSLVARARTNDPNAWTEIYVSYQPPIYRYVRARVFDEATAEDLTAAVFLSALKSIRAYRERGRPLLAWLYGIAHNTVAQHQRQTSQRARRGLLPRLFGVDDRTAEATASPFDQPDRTNDPAETVEGLDLRTAVIGLPDHQREVIILRHFVGLSTPEIAAAMGKSRSAVYSLEARALIALRERLN